MKRIENWKVNEKGAPGKWRRIQEEWRKEKKKEKEDPEVTGHKSQGLISVFTTLFSFLFKSDCYSCFGSLSISTLLVPNLICSFCMTVGNPESRTSPGTSHLRFVQPVPLFPTSPEGIPTWGFTGPFTFHLTDMEQYGMHKSPFDPAPPIRE